MHFWIDKRSQTCGFSGRHRVPSSISSGGFGRRGGGGLGLGLCSSTARNYGHTQAHIKLMVTPVHRFQSVECVAANAARHHARPHHHFGHQQPPSAHHHVSRQLSTANSTAACHHVPSAAASSYNGSVGPGTGGTGRGGAGQPAHSMELDSGVFLDVPLDGGVRGSAAAASVDQHHAMHAAGKLKCGMWASFAIVTVFMVGIKFYINNQSTGMEVLIFCSLLVVVLFAGCTVSLCEAVSTAPPTTAAIMEAAAQVRAPPPLHQDIESSAQASSEDLAAFGVHVPAQPLIHAPPPEPPPPPYHIAVLLPQGGAQQAAAHRRQHAHIIVDDSPPPAYDKVVS